jgi:hypothetical protein
MAEREKCYSFVLSWTSHETIKLIIVAYYTKILLSGTSNIKLGKKDTVTVLQIYVSIMPCRLLSNTSRATRSNVNSK